MGALAGAVVAAAVLALLFLLNRKVSDAKDLENNYEPPVLASIPRTRGDEKKPSTFLLDESSPLVNLESYAKLRMNLLYTLVGKKNHVVVVTSAISGDGKSTIAANLAISCATGGKRVLLVDADLRRACQQDIFQYDRKAPGLSELLVGSADWSQCVMKSWLDTLDILPAGQLPPNPAGLLSSPEMKTLLAKMDESYDLMLLDMPPINIVSDALSLSDQVAGCIFVARQNYSDHRDIRSALASAALTSMEVLGFVFYGEKLTSSKYYYQKKYYSRYEHKENQMADGGSENGNA